MQKAQVVIQTAFLGDLILTIPLLKRLKKMSPEEKLILVCRKGLGQFLRELEIVDQFIEIAKHDRKSYGLARDFLNSFEISYLYCVHRSVRSVLFSSQIRAHHKVGFSSILGFWVFDESVDYEKNWPDAIRKFQLVASRDIEIRSALSKSDLVALNEPLPGGSLPLVPSLFSFRTAEVGPKRKKQICLFPGSTWATKKWTLEGFKEVAKYFRDLDFDVLLLGAKDEKSLCDEIEKSVPGVKVLAGVLSISDSLGTMAESLLVIANDSAATHMAALTNTPVVTIFGPTTLSLGFRPWSNESQVMQINLDCRPCGAHGHAKCPLGHHQCMKLITSQSVIEKSLLLLNSR